MAARRSASRLTALFVAVFTLAQLLPPSAFLVTSSGLRSRAVASTSQPWVGSAADVRPTMVGKPSQEPRQSRVVPMMAIAGASMVVKQVLHVYYRVEIWRQRWIGPINLDRASMKVTGMDTYALVAAVLLQVLVGLYGVIEEPDPDAKIGRKIAIDAQIVLLTVAALCSTFTMVTFLLNKIYSTTALGVFKDVAYDVYQLSTRRQRYLAFWSLIVAMVSFLASFSLNLFSKLKGKRGYIATAVTSVVGGVMLWQWVQMMLVANQYIFRSSVLMPWR
mmetsp:Transcript_70331/g.195777  ORF Transcript_70331/g.195777 Transcript_70331/m.195777 type:complete len:276 (-) Transcript_70331:171-998(-)